MEREQSAVREFHEAFGILIKDKPEDFDPVTLKLRIQLIEEELQEFKDATDFPSRVDALMDILYVTLGACVSCGVDAENLFWLVHENNMAKRTGHRDENGKWIKPEGHEPPDIAGELRKLGWEG